MKTILFSLLALALPHFAWGQLIGFQATLTGDNEVPPNASMATGFGSGWLNPTTHELVWHETFTGLTLPAAAAHFHAPAPPGTNAPVTVPFAGFPNTTSGSYDITVILSELQQMQLLAGLFYANIHNAQYPGGEIRGQLTAVPEPATYALAGTAVLGLAALYRRRRATVPLAS